MANRKKDYDLEQITLELDDGTSMTCDVIAVFPVNINNENKMYMAVIDEEADPEEGEIFLYRALNLEDPDNIDVETIDDDEEFDAVADAFDELLDEDEFNAMFDEEDED